MPKRLFLLILVAAAAVAGPTTGSAAEDEVVVPEDVARSPAGHARNPAINDVESKLLAAARAANVVYQRHIEELKAELASGETERRVLALHKLGRTHDPLAVPIVTPFLDADIYDTATVRAACFAVINLGVIEAEAQLQRLANKEDQSDEHAHAVRLAALNALAQLKRMGKSDYKRESDTANLNTKAVGVTNLGTLKVEDAGDILSANLRNRSNHIRRMAAIGLGRLGNAEYGPQLTEALSDSDPLTRRYASEALVLIDYKPAIPYLLMAMDANIAGGNMVKAMRHLAGEDFGFNPYANIVRRREAVAAGFVWWEEHAKELDP